MNDYTLDSLFDISSSYFNGAINLSTPPSAKLSFSNVSPIGEPFGDINGATLALTAKLSSINCSIVTDFETAARFGSAVSGTGTVTFGADGLDLATGATNPSYAFVTWSANRRSIFKGNPVFSATFDAVTSTSNGILYMGLGRMDTGTFTSTVAHIGFKVTDGNLYATQADGTTESTLLLTDVGSGDIFNVICKVNGAVSVDYYFRKYFKSSGSVYSFNFSSVQSILTNMPTTNVLYMVFRADNNATTDSIRMMVHGASYTI